MDFDPPLKGWFSRDSLCYGVWVRVVAYIIKGGSGKKTGRGEPARNYSQTKLTTNQNQTELVRTERQVA